MSSVNTANILTSSSSIRHIMNLLDSIPDDLTVRELKEKIIKEILLSPYDNLGTPEGKTHTHWRTRLYNLLASVSLSEGMLRLGIDRIFSDIETKDNLDYQSRKNKTEWSAKFLLLPNLPKDLQNKFLRINHENCNIPLKIRDILTDFLPVWITNISNTSIPFDKKENMCLFLNSDEWKIKEENEKGVLISLSRKYITEQATRIILLPDVSKLRPGCALSVSPECNTIRDAIAWIYNLPCYWREFDKEV